MQPVGEIHSVMHPGSDAGKASPGTHWLSISCSQSSDAVAMLHFHSYITLPKLCYTSRAPLHFHTKSVTNPLSLGMFWTFYRHRRTIFSLILSLLYPSACANSERPSLNFTLFSNFLWERQLILGYIQKYWKFPLQKHNLPLTEPLPLVP